MWILKEYEKRWVCLLLAADGLLETNPRTWAFYLLRYIMKVTVIYFGLRF